MKYEAGVLSFSCEMDLFIQLHLDTGWEQLMKTGFNDLVFSSTFFWFIGLILTLLVLGSPLGYCLLVLGVFGLVFESVRSILDVTDLFLGEMWFCFR